MVQLFISCGFIVFDIVTGFTKALYNKEVDSTMLRRGLFHKLSEVLALLGAFLLGYVAEYIELGIELPLLNVVSVYICTMELVSIVENICEVNPRMFALFSPYLKKLKPKEGEKVDDRN